MASIETGQGFFTSQGILNTDSFKPQNSEPVKPESITPSQGSGESPSEEAYKIANDAAKVSTSRLNVASTGYDKGVAEYVATAVSSALSKKNKNSGTENTAVSFKGGTFQNEILTPRQASIQPAPNTAPIPIETQPAEPLLPPSKPEEPANPAEKRGSKRSDESTRGKRRRADRGRF